MAAAAGDIRVVRLGVGDGQVAQAMFTLLAVVFDEEHVDLSQAYLHRLLGDPDFWALAALRYDEVIGGLTAHTLMMTTSERSEVFLYDLAVHPSRQRQGIGRLLVEELVGAAAGSGIHEVFVPADDEDVHALDFYRSLGAVASPVTIFALGPEVLGSGDRATT